MFFFFFKFKLFLKEFDSKSKNKISSFLPDNKFRNEKTSILTKQKTPAKIYASPVIDRLNSSSSRDYNNLKRIQRNQVKLKKIFIIMVQNSFNKM